MAGKSNKKTVKKSVADGEDASKLIDARIQGLGDWRGKTLARVRKLIMQADPDVVEEVKWRKPSNAMLGVPVWSHDGIICTGETYKDKVKLTFAKGAAIDDPSGVFNASLTGNTRRAIDLHEGDYLDERAFKCLIRAAAGLNKVGTSRTRKGSKARAKPMEPVLLSGGNPQIAKGDGDAPVQAYIAAMPGWKGEVGRHLDALIEEHVPGVHKAVKWNSPFYGVENQGWFLSYHCFAKYVKVTFFSGASLRPIPPGESKHKQVRYLNIYEDVAFDGPQFSDWVKQASQLPGEKL